MTANNDEPTRQNPELGPMEGGQWRPVRPEELLRKHQPDDELPQGTPLPKVTLQRRQELEQPRYSSWQEFRLAG